MKVTKELLRAANTIIEDNVAVMDDIRIASIGCFGCGLGCSDTVGG